MSILASPRAETQRPVVVAARVARAPLGSALGLPRARKTPSARSVLFSTFCCAADISGPVRVHPSLLLEPRADASRRLFLPRSDLKKNQGPTEALPLGFTASTSTSSPRTGF